MVKALGLGWDQGGIRGKGRGRRRAWAVEQNMLYLEGALVFDALLFNNLKTIF